ncbi:MAG: cyclodeaminase/cyclohydrolase family protein [Phycisphaerales bacterium]|nr:cyclodeaminase/cyclohydrolase family protein [Phycisphaerales bacterium]
MEGILSISSFLDAVASKTPAPGGGAVAGAVGAQGAALATMVVQYSVGKTSLAAHQPALEAALERLGAFRALFERLAAEDAGAYAHYQSIRSSGDADAVAQAASTCVDIPRACLGASCDLLRFLETLPPITNTHLRSDLAIAAVLAEAAARAASWNVGINLGLVPEPDRDARRDEATTLVAQAKDLATRIEAACV